MIEAIGLGLAYLAGVGPARLALLATAVYAPLPALPLLLAYLKTRPRGDDRAALYCEAVASELRGGESLTGALVAAAAPLGVTLPAASLPPSIPEIVTALREELPDVADELGATIETAARSGGGAADLFDEIGSLAIARAEIAREVRVASAAARATAWIFVLAPVGYLWWQVRSGALAGLLAVPHQRVAVVAGLALFLAGLAAVVLVLWRAR